MKKNIIAIGLVFALLLSFASCRKFEDTDAFAVESKVYAVDDEGNSHNLIKEETDGETKYYYIDSNGNRVYVDSKDVVVETTKVFKGTTEESVSLTPEEQSFLDQYNDPDAFNNIIDSSITTPEMDLSSDLLPEDSFEEIEVELDGDGNPVHEDIEKTYEELLAGEKFTIDVVFKSTVNGTETIVPLKASRDGDKVYMETAIPVEGQGSLKCNAIVRDGTCYFIVPSMRAYMTIPAESMSEMFPDEVITESEQEANYVSSGEVEFEGEKYICDVYESEGVVSKSYYKDGELKRIETVDGENITIIQFNEVSDKVDSSVFKVPAYFDMTKLLGSSLDVSSMIR